MSSLMPIVLIALSLSSICRTDLQSDVNSCLDKTQSDFGKCGQTVAKKWKCNLDFSGEQMYCKSVDRECCAMWDTFDCFGDTVKTQCGETNFEEINTKQFQTQIKKEEGERCPQLKYKSNECKELLKEVEKEPDPTPVGLGKGVGEGVKPEGKSGLSDSNSMDDNKLSKNTAKRTENSVLICFLTLFSFILLLL